MKYDAEHRYGIKILTETNFLEPSPAALMFSMLGLSTMGPAPATQEQIALRVARFTRVTLNDSVPEQLWKMFEVAKGAMVYGIFFYPLYTLGEEQLYRVFEYLVRLQYEKLSGPKPQRNVRAQVQWLIDNEHFPEPAPDRWMAMYELRNIASHPTMQQITGPPQAARTLHEMKGLIEHFYPTRVK